ncbi:MAG: hypothetical protein VKO00_11495 [Cyanobacteriota bacterium]|nr:hypothetical protein [Cyanobacteriota bacterium]
MFRSLPPLAGFLGLALGALGLVATAPALAAPPSPTLLQSLEAALNGSAGPPLAALLEAGPGLEPAQVERRHRLLREQFPDARWQVRPGPPQANGQPTVVVRVVGSRRQGSRTYRLETEQQLRLESNGPRINGQTILSEQSLLRSGERDLPVSLLIPDAVLTGQRYDVDVIFDDPLEGALVAGGIAAVSADQQATLASPAIELAALGGGGLFKTVQAPLTPGSQMWAVLLVHPDGIVSASKRVRVVASRQALDP